MRRPVVWILADWFIQYHQILAMPGSIGFPALPEMLIPNPGEILTDR